MPAATLALAPRLNGHHKPHQHPQPRPHVPDPSLLIQQFADPGNCQSYLDLAREHNLTLDELVAFFDHPDTLNTLDGLDRISRRRAESIAAAAHPQALQTLTQITYIPTIDAPATTIEAVRKASTTLAHLSSPPKRGRSRHAEDEPPPPLPTLSSSGPLSLWERPGEGSPSSLRSLHGFPTSPTPLLSTSHSTKASRLLHRLAQTNTPFTPLTISAPRHPPASRDG